MTRYLLLTTLCLLTLAGCPTDPDPAVLPDSDVAEAALALAEDNEARIAALESYVVALDAVDDAAKDARSDLTSDLFVLSSEVSTNANAIATLTLAVEDNADDIEEHTNDLTAVWITAETANTAASTAQSLATTADTSADAAQTAAAGAVADVAAITGDITALNTQVAAVAVDALNAQGSANTNAGAIAANAADIATNAASIANNVTGIADNVLYIATNGTDITTNANAIATVQTSLLQTGTDVATNTSAISAISNELVSINGELASQLAALVAAQTDASSALSLLGTLTATTTLTSEPTLINYGAACSIAITSGGSGSLTYSLVVLPDEGLHIPAYTSNGSPDVLTQTETETVICGVTNAGTSGGDPIDLDELPLLVTDSSGALYALDALPNTAPVTWWTFIPDTALSF